MLFFTENNSFGIEGREEKGRFGGGGAIKTTRTIFKTECDEVCMCICVQLLEKPKFSKVEKIKTIGSTYMAVSGLDKGTNEGPKSAKSNKYSHIVTMAMFAFEIQKKIDTINKHCFNDFKLRIGEERRGEERETKWLEGGACGRGS